MSRLLRTISAPLIVVSLIALVVFAVELAQHRPRKQPTTPDVHWHYSASAKSTAGEGNSQPELLRLPDQIKPMAFNFDPPPIPDLPITAAPTVETPTVVQPKRDSGPSPTTLRPLPEISQSKDGAASEAIELPPNAVYVDTGKRAWPPRTAAVQPPLVAPISDMPTTKTVTTESPKLESPNTASSPATKPSDELTDTATAPAIENKSVSTPVAPSEQLLDLQPPRRDSGFVRDDTNQPKAESSSGGDFVADNANVTKTIPPPLAPWQQSDKQIPQPQKVAENVSRDKVPAHIDLPPKSDSVELTIDDLEEVEADNLLNGAKVVELPVPKINRTAPSTAPEISDVQIAKPIAPPAVAIAASPVARPEPNRAMQAVTQQADRLIEHGMSLASRGALYAARVEFIQALRMITQALDTLKGTTEHSRSLARGMQALEEADDFVPRGTQLEGNLNLSAIVVVHKTPVLHDEDLSDMTPLVALQRYYTYAQDQFAKACGGEPVASRALYGIGKLHTELGGQSGDASRLNGPKAMAFHQAALIVEPKNHRAANELGVLLARYGQLDEARNVLLQSLRTKQLPEAWHNLAVVHKRLGETDLADRAEYEYQLATGREKADPSNDGNPVRWVEPQTFVRMSPRNDEDFTVAAPQLVPDGQETTGTTTTNKSWWWPWK